MNNESRWGATSERQTSQCWSASTWLPCPPDWIRFPSSLSLRWVVLVIFLTLIFEIDHLHFYTFFPCVCHPASHLVITYLPILCLLIVTHGDVGNIECSVCLNIYLRLLVDVFLYCTPFPALYSCFVFSTHVYHALYTLHCKSRHVTEWGQA